jgi:hypothetical protein
VEPAADSAPSPSLAVRLELLEERMATIDHRLGEQLKQALAALEFLVDDDPRGRRRLAELRASPEYLEAYTEDKPLISVLIPTWNRTELLVGSAIPSVLAQSYENVEVVVVGDCSPPELAAAVEAIGDPRVRFHNLTIRGPYDEDPYRAWCASGTPPLNAGLERVRGRWITVIGDDDEMPASHLDALLRFAREQHVEFAYGWYRFLDPDGGTRRVGSFPPKLGYTGLQTALWHSGLRFLKFELAHAVFSKPNDWGLIERMMRIGVSMAQTDEISVDYRASGRGEPALTEPPADESGRLLRLIGDLEQRSNELEQAGAGLEQSLAESRATVLDLQRRIEEVRQSRSWRLITLLRRVRSAVGLPRSSN